MITTFLTYFVYLLVIVGFIGTMLLPLYLIIAICYALYRDYFKKKLQ